MVACESSVCSGTGLCELRLGGLELRVGRRGCRCLCGRRRLCVGAGVGLGSLQWFRIREELVEQASCSSGRSDDLPYNETRKGVRRGSAMDGKDQGAVTRLHVHVHLPMARSGRNTPATPPWNL